MCRKSFQKKQKRLVIIYEGLCNKLVVVDIDSLDLSNALGKRCDYVCYYQNNFLILVEFKGKHIKDALKQILSTINLQELWNVLGITHRSFSMKYAVIIASSVTRPPKTYLSELDKSIISRGFLIKICSRSCKLPVN